MIWIPPIIQSNHFWVFFFPGKKMRCHDFPWRLLRENRTPPPQESLQAPWMTSSSWRWCAMTSHTGPRLGRDQGISRIVFIWEDHFEGILAFFLRKFHWKLDSLVYIWLSKTEPWIVFFLACINIPKCNHGWWWWIKNTQTRTKRFFWLLVGDTLKLCNIETCAFYTLLVKAFLFQKKDVNVHPLKWMIAFNLLHCLKYSKNINSRHNHVWKHLFLCVQYGKHACFDSPMFGFWRFLLGSEPGPPEPWICNGIDMDVHCRSSRKPEVVQAMRHLWVLAGVVRKEGSWTSIW